MTKNLTDIALIFVFILVGGVFAAAEMSLVSLRDSQVKQLAAKGKRGRTVASLSSNPNRFLSAVQIGVTLSGFLAASFGGATLAASLSPHLVGWGMPKGAADALALVLVTIVISYFSIVLGELTAKRLAMQRSESFALALSPMVNAIAIVMRPIIWFLGVSTNVAVRIFGGDPKASREVVSDEEIRALVSGSATLGEEERQIVDEVFDAGQRSLREVMVPRTEVDFLDGSMPAYTAMRLVQGAPHSRYPVTGDSVDDVVGFLHVRDLMDLDPSTRHSPVSQLVRPVTSLPETVKVLHALTEMRRTASHLAIVRDEYGGTAGIVTLEDLVEELIGEVTDEYDVPTQAVIRHGATADVDGLMTLEQFADLGGVELPEGPYDTLAGYWVAQRGQLPTVGDSVTVSLPSRGADPEAEQERFVFTVAELDGRRASRISVRRIEDTPPPGDDDQPADAPTS